MRKQRIEYNSSVDAIVAVAKERGAKKHEMATIDITSLGCG